MPPRTSERSSGILLHPTSLPGAFGIGDLGPGAMGFVEWLASARQHVWQVLPLGPTGFGDSPYQCFSAFAGNPLLISLERLVEEGLLTPRDAGDPRIFSDGDADFPSVIAHRRGVWPKVLDRLDASGASPLRERFDRFRTARRWWLDDFALFMALKAAHGDVAWTGWPAELAGRDPAALARWAARCAREIRLQGLLQFLFFEQWGHIRRACRAHGIQVLGDLPIFVAHDSADVWAHPEWFRLQTTGAPAVLTGVPPDYFSATGQLWGNPHYRWDALADTGYAWWVARVRTLLTLVDRVRIDHFRGFAAAWEVPSDADTAMLGSWVQGPGPALFDALRLALVTDRLPFVAENLGVITPDVEALRQRFGLPGMAILQFAFGRDPQAPTFKPHNYDRHLVVYTGTHDNDTTMGWWSGDAGHSTRSNTEIEEERERAGRYLAIDGTEVHWAFIRAVLASVADTAIVPAQDVLGLGSEARMNRPGIASGNWRWRLRPGQLTPGLAERLAQLTNTYDRG